MGTRLGAGAGGLVSSGVDGHMLPLGAPAGGKGNRMGISSSGLEKTGEEEMLAEPSHVA